MAPDLGSAILLFAVLLGVSIGLSAQTGIGEIHLPGDGSLRCGRGQKAKLDRTVIANTKSPTVFAKLPLGRYRLEVPKTGFAKFSF